MYKGRSRNSFFDAVVEMVHRVKHSKRVYCRCTFELKWLAPQLKDERMTLPSKSIMKISDMGIETHPVVAEFMTSSYPSADAELLSISSLFEKPSCEFGGLLEKQVEEISKYAAGMDFLEDNILGVKEATPDGYKESKVAITSGSVLSTDLTGLNTKGKSKQFHMEVKDAPPTLLSPLAARAALASLIHELPKEMAFPIYQIDKEFPLSPAIALKSDSFSNKNVSEAPNPCENLSCEGSDVSNRKRDNQYNLTSSTNSDVDVNLSGLRVTRRLTRSAAQKKIPSIEQRQANGIIDGTVNSSSISSTSQKSSHEGSNEKEFGRRGFKRDKEDLVTSQKNKKPSDISNSPVEPVAASKELDNRKLCKLSVSKHSTNSVVDSNLNCPTVSRRLTRSAAQREVLSLCAEQELTTNGAATSPICSNPTFSTDRKAKSEGNTEKDNAPINSTQDTKDIVTPQKNKKSPDISNLQTKLLSDLKERHIKNLGSNSLMNDRPSEADSNLGALMVSKRVTRSAGQRERLSVSVGQQQDPINLMTSPVSSNSTPSTDHKKASHEGKAKKDFRPVNLRKNLDNVGTPEKNEIKKTVSLSSSADTSTNVMHGMKRTQSSCDIASCDGNEAQDAESQPAKKKRMPAPNPVLRSSPQLNFLPRTRSRVKATQP